nr:hypothetical protein GCM10020093_049550 [Planobispora longispora]
MNWFSPSGKLFTTVCPREKGICVWDTATGNRRHTVPITDVDELLGWFNENHLLVVKNVGKNRQAQVIDFVGGRSGCSPTSRAGSTPRPRARTSPRS